MPPEIHSENFGLSKCSPGDVDSLLNSSGNSAAEIHSENFPNLTLISSQLAEILRWKSTVRISASINAHREMLNSSGNSAAEIYSESFPSLTLTSSHPGNDSAAEIHSENSHSLYLSSSHLKIREISLANLHCCRESLPQRYKFS